MFYRAPTAAKFRQEFRCPILSPISHCHLHGGSGPSGADAAQYLSGTKPTSFIRGNVGTDLCARSALCRMAGSVVPHGRLWNSYQPPDWRQLRCADDRLCESLVSVSTVGLVQFIRTSAPRFPSGAL